jgi:hypothetical protein
MVIIIIKKRVRKVQYTMSLQPDHCDYYANDDDNNELMTITHHNQIIARIIF